MAVSSKTARNITVAKVRYRWRATGNDGCITLVIWPHELPGDKIVCSFGYHQTAVPLDDRVTTLIKQLVITNRLVRRVVDHVLAKGYDPRVKEMGQVNLGAADELIDLSDAERGR
jgi:hypothetical protein